MYCLLEYIYFLYSYLLKIINTKISKSERIKLYTYLKCFCLNVKPVFKLEHISVACVKKITKIPL